MGFDQQQSAPLGDARRKRLRFRAWHRGMRELDLVLGPFVDRHLSGFSDEEIDELERLLGVPDGTLYRWLSGQEAAPAEHDTPLLRRLVRWAADRAS